MANPDEGLQSSNSHPRDNGHAVSSATHDKPEGDANTSKEGNPLEHPLLFEATPSTVLVEFGGDDDPYQPLNWPFRKKVMTTFLYGLTTCWITFASAVFSAGLRQVADEFHVTTEVTAAGVSLIVFGFGLGSMIWAPLSEVYGRKWVIIVVCVP